MGITGIILFLKKSRRVAARLMIFPFFSVSECVLFSSGEEGKDKLLFFIPYDLKKENEALQK